MIFEVTKKDIRLGRNGCGYSCPIYRAVRRKLKTSRILVCTHAIRIENKIYLLPPTARIFSTVQAEEAALWRAGSKDFADLKPFSFRLPIKKGDNRGKKKCP